MASFGAEGSAEVGFEAGFDSAASVAATAVEQSDIGTEAKEWAGAVGAGIAAGAAAGAVCGPAAPICSTIGAVIGALVALGIKLSQLIDPPPYRCNVMDLGCKAARWCDDDKLIWTPKFNALERTLDKVTIVDAPEGITPGLMVWCMRRIKEDGLGGNHLVRLQRAMRIPETDFQGATFEVTDSMVSKRVESIKDSILKLRVNVNVADSVMKDAARMAILRNAGASILEAHQAIGRKPRGCIVRRHDRGARLIESEFARRRIGEALPPSYFDFAKQDGKLLIVVKPTQEPSLFEQAKSFALRHKKELIFLGVGAVLLKKL